MVIKMVRLNVLEMEKSEYTGGKSSLCPGCGHDQISNNIIQAAWENGINHEKIAKMLSLIHISEPTRPLYIT